ncbi:MAG: hypothetical protein M0Z67_13700 [Nitrospiraceae bacterium]|nr:hypothetical protein [Nitrospiraceae bacterium]
MKANVFYLVALVAALVITFPSNLLAEDSPQKPNKVEAKDDRVDVDVEDAEIPDVLKEIEKGSGIKITIGEALTGKKVTAKFADKDLEGALREILRGQYYVLSYKHDLANKEKKTLTEVKAEGDVIGSKQLKGKLITVEIPYGKGPGEVRAVKESEGGSIGPRSFAVDAEGKIYICDTWNGRVQVLSPTGIFLFTIPLKDDIFAEDIVVDDRGYIYIYDGSVRKLYQIDELGKVLSSIDVESPRSVTLPLHYARSAIYFVDCYADHCGYFVIGRILLNGLLVGPSEEERMNLKGQDQSTLRLSGRKYEARKFIRGYNTQIDVIEKDGLTSRMLSLPAAEGILHGRLNIEDSKGNLYFARTYLKDNYQLWYIDEFDSKANYLGTAQIPSGNGYEFWAVKEFALGKNGNIYKFIPGEKNLTLHIFLNEEN